MGREVEELFKKNLINLQENEFLLTFVAKKRKTVTIGV